MTATTSRPSGQELGANAPGIAAPGTPNTVLADLREAAETYADRYLVVEMYAVNPDGGVLNPGDSASFKVRVHNNGPLDVRDLTVLLTGRNGTRVGRHGWTNGQSSYGSAVLDKVPAHMFDGDWVDVVDDDHDHFHFWVHSTMPESDLVTVTVQDWNLDLLHLLNAHTDPGTTPHFVYRDEVHPA